MSNNPTKYEVLIKQYLRSILDISILGNPGAASRDDAIFSGESLLQELQSPWELILTELVPEVVEFRPADSAMRSSRVTLSPSYTK